MRTGRIHFMGYRIWMVIPPMGADPDGAVTECPPGSPCVSVPDEVLLTSPAFEMVFHDTFIDLAE